MTNICTRPRCGRVAQKCHHGLCQQHYRVWRKNHKPVPATIITSRLNTFRAAGLNWTQISHLTGVPKRTLHAIHRKKYVLAATATPILNTPVPKTSHCTSVTDWTKEALSDGTLVPAVGTIRRLRALIAIGYHNAFLAERIGCGRKHLTSIIRGEHERCTAGVARRVDTLFHELQLTPAPNHPLSRQARGRAKKSGWPPPLAWDEETIDDPTVEPDTEAYLHADQLNGWRTAELADIVADYRACGYSNKHLADQLGITVHSLRRLLSRAGITAQEHVA